MLRQARPRGVRRPWRPLLLLLLLLPPLLLLAGSYGWEDAQDSTPAAVAAAQRGEGHRERDSEVCTGWLVQMGRVLCKLGLGVLGRAWRRPTIVPSRELDIVAGWGRALVVQHQSGPSGREKKGERTASASRCWLARARGIRMVNPFMAWKGAHVYVGHMRPGPLPLVAPLWGVCSMATLAC